METAGFLDLFKAFFFILLLYFFMDLFVYFFLIFNSFQRKLKDKFFHWKLLMTNTYIIFFFFGTQYSSVLNIHDWWIFLYFTTFSVLFHFIVDTLWIRIHIKISFICEPWSQTPYFWVEENVALHFEDF